MSDKTFIGRSNEMEVIKGIISEAKSGDASSVFLSGRRGIGKTSLIMHLAQELFNDRSGPAPFLYTIKTAFTSIEKFSKDYLISFIIQNLAFHRIEPSLQAGTLYSLEDLREIAEKSEAPWITDLIDGYKKVLDSGESIKLFSYVMSVPYTSYALTGNPVVVLIDDFHKLRKFSELNADEDGRDFWMLIENMMHSGHVPHVISGNQADLNRMFFEESAMGDLLDVVNLMGLNRENSGRFFNALCDKYALRFEGDLSEFFSIFNGNPLYIKSFIQSARQTGKSLSREDAWEIYFREVIKGKLKTYWTSLLESYIPQFELRRPTLIFLWFLLTNDNDIALSNLTEDLAKNQNDLDRIIRNLNASGAVETGFSTLEIMDDRVLSDVIKGLYLNEVRRESVDEIRDEIIGHKYKSKQQKRAPSFDVTIPSDPNAELIAVKSLEQVALHHKVPMTVVGQLQIALVELFTNIIAKDNISDDNYHLSFRVTDNMFAIEVKTPPSGYDYASPDNDQVFKMMRYYVDDIKIERIMNSSRITLTKNIGKD
ncbi:MAG: AAA family ATPase [Nitrospiraceae bacterium]|nr:MAG: AAA family ATPase [Nitrospiraceae bacterium]